MSISLKTFFSIIFIFCSILLCNTLSFSQEVEINIKILSFSPSKLQIEGRFLKNENSTSKTWTFLQNYADVQDLDKRIENLRFFGKKGEQVSYKKLGDGDFLLQNSVARFSYEVKTNIPKNVISSPHITWFDRSHGLLMLNDLLPTFGKGISKARVKIQIPNNWKISTSEKRIGEKTFLVKDLEDAIFLIGNNWREKELRVQNTKLRFSIYGKWQFEDSEAFRMAYEILEEYSKLFGEIPTQNAQIFLLPFPKKLRFGRWRAETRGTNVTILSSPTTFKSYAPQRLHEQLRHEILHLWIPNGLNLSGDYAWFYEGFILYQALKTGVKLGQIRFKDFLNTLGQSFDVIKRRSSPTSLIEMSRFRWSRRNSSVYSKGLVVAFLCDVALLNKSKRKTNLTNIFREIYQKHNKQKARKEAESAIMKALERYDELKQISEKYIKGEEKIILTNYLTKTGIKDNGNSFFTKLAVKSKLRRREKALLKKLGYNR